MTERMNKLIICVNSEEVELDYTELGLTFDSTDDQFLQVVAPMISERFPTVVLRQDGQWKYKTNRAVNTGSVYLIPNSVNGVSAAG